MQDSPTRPNRTHGTRRLCHSAIIARVLVAWLLAGLASAAIAETWIGADGDWFTASNWDTNTVPTAVDPAYILNGATVTINSNGARADSVSIGVGAGTTGHLVIDNASDTFSSPPVLVGHSGGTGILDIRNGAQVNAYNLNVGTNGTATVTVDGAGTTLTADNFTTFITSGSLTISDGATFDASGRGVVVGGIGNAGLVNIGAGGNPGVLDAVVVGGSGAGGTLSFNHTGSGHYFTSDGTSGGTAVSISGSLAVRQVNTGMTILTGANTYTGGTALEAGTLGVSASNNLGAVSSDLTFDGGTLQTTASFTDTRDAVLNAGGGTFNTDAATTLTQDGTFAGTGSLIKTGAGTLVISSTNTYTGGTFLSAGTVSVSSDANLGSAFGSLTFDGGTLLTTAALNMDRATVLNAGGGTFTISVSTVIQNGSITGTGELTKDGAGTLALGSLNNWSGDTTLNAGTLQQATGNFSGNSTYTVNGGTLDLNGSSASIQALAGTGGTVDLDSAPLSVVQNTNTTYAGVITGTGGLNKFGTGTLTLAGASTHTGTTQIVAGSLLVTGSLASSLTLVSSGATLGGTGSVGDVQLSGTMAPGASAGTLNTGNLVMNTASILDMELDTPGVVGGGVNDLIVVTGDLTLDGTLAISDLGGFGVGNYTLMTYSGALTDNGLTLPAPSAGLTYNLVSGGGSVVLTVSALYDLTYNAGANGSLTGTTSQVVVHGDDGTAVTAVPDTNYHFAQWSDGSTANPRTDTNVTGTITVTAQFAVDSYTLNYGAGANGTVTGSTSQTVGHGSSGTAVTAVPDAESSFIQWSDGRTDNPRADLNVTGPVSVTAQFSDPIIGTFPVADAGDYITMISHEDELTLFFDGYGSTDAEDTGDQLDYSWALDNRVIANGPTLALTLANGQAYNLTLIVMDSDGNVDYDLVRVTLRYPDEWPYNGATVDPGLGLGLNNIALFDSNNGLVYSCAAAYDNDGNRLNDKSFNITLALLAPNGFGENQELVLVDMTRFNPDNELTADGEVPDCSGRFYPGTLLFTDYLAADGETGFYTLELIDLVNIVLRVSEYQQLQSE